MKSSNSSDCKIVDAVKRVEESRRLKKMYLEEKSKAEIVAEALKKLVRLSRRREMAKKTVIERGA